MMTPSTIQSYVKAQPFLPFRISMAGGKTYDVRHPETVKVAKTSLIVFTYVSDEPEIVDRWEAVSLVQMESISHLNESFDAARR